MCFINVLLFLNLRHDKKSFRNTAWNSAEVNVQRSGEIFNKFYRLNLFFKFILYCLFDNCEKVFQARFKSNKYKSRFNSSMCFVVNASSVAFWR